MRAQRIDPVSIRRDVLAPLTAVESIAFQAIKQIISEGRQATKAEICAAIGSDNYDGGTVPGIIKRLETKGYVTRSIYQRGFQVCIGDQCSAAPSDTSPHWRQREAAVPIPAIQAVRQKAPELAALIEREARARNRPLSAFLADLVYIGWHGYQAEMEGLEA